MSDRDIALANIDRLQSLELQGAALPYGVKARLFEAAQSVHKGSMVDGAARILSGPPRVIGIVTGAQVPEKMPLGENDGPLGSVILAQALRKIGHTVNFYTDDAAAMPIEKLLNWLEVEAPVIRLERGNEDAQIEIANTLDVAVAVERLGGNPNGILYGATGVSRSDFRCNADTLFQKMSALGKASIGIADGGNEIGCGKIHEIISQTLSELNYCDRTPCGGGVFSVVPTDVLVIATTSNLGCAGIVAALALLQNDASLCHSAKDELRLIEKGVEIGLTDGGTGKVIAAVDGVDASDHAALVGLMQSIVQRALAGPEERGF
jgi:D-glutamate cyclase